MTIMTNTTAGGGQRDDPEIHRRDAQQVAEERGLEVQGEFPVGGDHGHAQGEARRRHHPDGGIGAHQPAVADEVDQHRAHQRPGARRR